MDDKKAPVLLMNLRYLLLNPLKFYDVDITPVIFLVILALSFSSVLFPESLMQKEVFINTYNAISVTVIYIMSSIYLFAYLDAKKGRNVTLSDILAYMKKKCIKVILAALLFGGMLFIVIFTALLVQIQPILTIVSLALIIVAFILYIMFVFHTCFIIEQDMGIIEAFRSSKRITAGRKGEIFLVIFLFNLVIFIPLFIIYSIAATTENILIWSFVISFIGTITTLVQQRLMADIYLLIKNNGVSG